MRMSAVWRTERSRWLRMQFMILMTHVVMEIGRESDGVIGLEEMGDGDDDRLLDGIGDLLRLENVVDVVEEDSD
jgi:hypothetical protein